MTIKKLNGEQVKAIICILLLFSTTVVVFQYTLTIREPWFGELSDGRHQWLSGTTIKFSKNWYREGPLNLRFAMLENPASIEFPDISSREPYVNYMPGCVIPIYFSGVITGKEPNPSLLMNYNLLNHLLIAFLLSLLIFSFLRQIKIDFLNSFLFATIPLFLELLLPAPLYWHQNVFFADQAVILPFVLYIFLEVLQDGFKERYNKYFCIIQNLILFYGFLTDWLFVFIALTVYLKRVFEGKIQFNRNIGDFLKQSFKFWVAPIIAVIIFLSQIYLLGTISSVISKFLYRTGISPEGSEIIHKSLSLFKGHILLGYGEIGVNALSFSLIILAIVLWFVYSERLLKHNTDVKIKRIVALISILLIPCILQVIMFSNHSVFHSFSVLKFSVPLATIPFVLAPIALYLILKSHVNFHDIKFGLFKNLKIDFGLLVIFLVVVAAASFYIVNEHPHYRELFPPNNENLTKIGNSIQKNTNYSDIIFSPNFKIPINPPQQLSYSMKRVYKINSTDDIVNYTQGLSDYHVVIMFISPPEKKWEEKLVNATLFRDGNYYYYRLN